MDKLDFMKTKTFALQNALLREWKDKLQTKRKCLWGTYLTKHLYLDPIKNSQTNQLIKAKDLNTHFTNEL